MAQWLSNEDLAEEFGVPLPTVRRWRYTGDGPPGVKLGRHVRYRREDVDRWLAERAQQDRARAGVR